jgi:hypothetical protein
MLSPVLESRLQAMLAAVGWPLGELVNWGFLHEFGGLYGRTPSVLNGAMLEVYAPFFFLVAGAASYAELQAIEKGIGADGDFAFDPLSVAERASAAGVGADDMRLKEVLNGRLASAWLALDPSSSGSGPLSQLARCSPRGRWIGTRLRSARDHGLRRAGGPLP